MLGLDIASVVKAQPRVADSIILLAGDGDMHPAVVMARDANHILILAHGEKNTYDQELWDNVDERIRLDAAFLNDVAIR